MKKSGIENPKSVKKYYHDELLGEILNYMDKIIKKSQKEKLNEKQLCLIQDIKEINGQLLMYHQLSQKDHFEVNNLINFKLDFESIITKLSSEFIVVDYKDLNKLIDKSLKIIGKFIGIERVYVAISKDDNKYFSISNFWEKKGSIGKQKLFTKIKLNQFPELKKRIFDKKEVLVTQDVFKLGKKDSNFKKIVQALNIKSSLTVPMLIGKKVKGFIGFISTSHKKIWIDDEIHLLKNFSQILANVLERKEMDNKLNNKVKLESLLANISKTFLKTGDISKQINSSLKLVGDFSQVDRVYIFEFSNNLQIMNNTHERCNKGIKSQIKFFKKVPSILLPHWFKNFKMHKAVQIESVSKLPIERQEEKEILESQGVQSLLAVPMLFHDEIIGFIGFETVKSKIKWSLDDIEILTILSDIITNAMKRQEVEENLRVNEEHYRTVIETAKSIILEWDMNGNIIYLNEYGREFFDYKLEEIMGKNIVGTIMPDTNESNLYIKNLLQKPEDYQINENRNIDKHLNRKFISWTNSKLLDKKGKTQKLISIGNDLTERQQIEEELNDARDRVDRIVRHDLKGPLSTIIGYPDLMMDDENLSDDQRKYLTIIQKSGKKMLKQINNSMTLFKVEQGTYKIIPEPYDIVKMLNYITMDLDNKLDYKKLKIDLYINNKLIKKKLIFNIMSDGDLLNSLLANLLRNAIEASPEGKKITIKIDDLEDDYYNISMHNFGTIPMQIRKKFFDKLVTFGKQKGTGLGTYIAKLIVDAHQGKIWFETNKNNGTTIFVRIPKEIHN